MVNDRDIIYKVKGPKLLGELTGAEAEEIFNKTDIAVIACGTTEFHGYHNPLGADYFEAEELIRRTLVKLDDEGIPTVGLVTRIGVTHDRMSWKGTLSLSNSTFMAMLKEVCMNLIHHGIKKIALIMFHSDNWPPMMVVARDIVSETDAQVICLNWVGIPELEEFSQSLSDSEVKGRGGEVDGHGGEHETSKVMAAVEELVDLSKAVDYHPEYKQKGNVPYDRPVREEERIPADTRVLHGGQYWMHTKDYRYVTPECGHVGNPTKASKEKGAKEFDWIADWITKIIKRDFVA